MTTYVATDAPVKFAVVKLRNHSGRARRLTLTGYWELVLGEWRHANLMHVATEKDADTGALFARNPYSRSRPGRVFFAQSSEGRRTITGNRAEFIGRNGSLSDPAAMRRMRLSGRMGVGLDPCGAIQTQLELADGQEQEIVYWMFRNLGLRGNEDLVRLHSARYDLSVFRQHQCGEIHHQRDQHNVHHVGHDVAREDAHRRHTERLSCLNVFQLAQLQCLSAQQAAKTGPTGQSEN